jgi:hypothetical protein
LIIDWINNFDSDLLDFGLFHNSKLEKLEEVALKIKPTNGFELSRSVTKDGVILGKPRYAEVVIEFEPLENADSSMLYDELVVNLSSNNFQQSSFTQDFYKGIINQGFNQIHVTVIITNELQNVQLSLTYR